MWWVGITTSIAMVEESTSYFPLLILDNCHFGLLGMFLIKIMARPTCGKNHTASSKTLR